MAIFLKVLINTDVERRLSFPDGCVTALPSFHGGRHAVDLKVKDDDGNVWNFGCTIGSGVSPRPVIFSGWIQFARAKHLEQGDMVMLYREDDMITKSQYKIEVKRST